MAVSAFLVSAPASHHGKTLLSAALVHHYRRRGLRVAAFKMGPDYLDAMILARAAGRPVDNLDPWMVGEAGCRRLFARACAEVDVVVVEGAMGLSDGMPSTADLARLLGLPVVLVVDAAGMAQGFAGACLGARVLEPDLEFVGVLANRVAGGRHQELIRARLPGSMPFLGAVAREAALSLPERHLGLVPAQEVVALGAVLDRAADQLAATGLADPPPCPPRVLPLSPGVSAGSLAGLRLAVARDAAFCFLYPANLAWLRDQGVALRFFSPLAGEGLPDCDAVWLPGGYPELHLQALAANEGLRADLAAHHRRGRPILAECGGMLYLLEALVDREGRRHELAGLLPGEGGMTGRPQGLGLQALPWTGAVLRGHTFHYARVKMGLDPVAQARRHPDGAAGEWVWWRRGLWASFMHLYFPSAPEAVAAILRGEPPSTVPTPGEQDGAGGEEGEQGEP